ncbi:MAG TPA: DAK2 domain-containing protein [Acidothermaceae bacterium]
MLEALDAAAVRRWYEGGLAALDAMREEINSLNVFPVPDADTGTNLHLTLGSAAGSSKISDDAPAGDLAATAMTMARESLLGARGSSGVILSQLLRGVAEVLAAQRLPPRGKGLTRALERAVALAYAAVAHPVEGTMLTVARAAAEAARATGSDDLHTVVAAAVGAAHRALAQTPEQLDVLGQAGVVDAGGRGVVLLLDALQAVVEERPMTMPTPSIAHPRPAAVAPVAVSVPAYEVMYLIDVPDDRVPGIRAALDAIGDSVVVSGGDGLWNVHVHTDDAGAAIDAGTAIGHAHRIRVTPLAGAADRIATAPDDAHVVRLVIGDDSPLAAVRDALCDAGATLADDGRPAVVLIDAALAAAPRSEARVAVDTPVAALAALAVHDPALPAADDAAAMAAAAAAVRCVRVPGAGADSAARCVETLRPLVDERSELVTVVAERSCVARIEGLVRAEYPRLQVATVACESDVVWLGVE